MYGVVQSLLKGFFQFIIVLLSFDNSYVAVLGTNGNKMYLPYLLNHLIFDIEIYVCVIANPYLVINKFFSTTHCYNLICIVFITNN